MFRARLADGLAPLRAISPDNALVELFHQFRGLNLREVSQGESPATDWVPDGGRAVELAVQENAHTFAHVLSGNLGEAFAARFRECEENVCRSVLLVSERDSFDSGVVEKNRRVEQNRFGETVALKQEIADALIRSRIGNGMQFERTHVGSKRGADRK
jgi:hypothetical protein